MKLAWMLIVIAAALCCGCINGRATLVASTMIDGVDYRFEYQTK